MSLKNNEKNLILFSNQYQNAYLLDSWSFIHFSFFFLSEILLHSKNKSSTTTILYLFMICFEYWENSNLGIKFAKNTFGVKNYNGDTPINILGDFLSNSFGIEVGNNISKKYSGKKKNKRVLKIFLIAEFIPFLISNESLIIDILNKAYYIFVKKEVLFKPKNVGYPHLKSKILN